MMNAEQGKDPAAVQTIWPRRHEGTKKSQHHHSLLYSRSRLRFAANTVTSVAASSSCLRGKFICFDIHHSSLIISLNPAAAQTIWPRSHEDTKKSQQRALIIVPPQPSAL